MRFDDPAAQPLRRLAMTALILYGILMSAAAQQRASSPPTAEALMGAALHQEEVEGNLEAAVATYKQVIADPRASRALAATALLHLGRSYEKLGDGEARTTYERVVRDFADQGGSVTTARARLVALGPSASAGSPSLPIRRRIIADLGQYVQGLSPNGRYAAILEDDGLTLAITDLQTGIKRPIRMGDRSTRGLPEGESAWSRDGKHLVYNWEYVNSPDYRAELWIASLDGSDDRLLYRFGQAIDHVDMFDWTPDGLSILVLRNHRDGSQDMALMSAADGSVRVIKRFTRRVVRTPPALAPDGRTVAYSYVVTRPGGSERDVFLIGVDGTGDTPLAQGMADDWVVGWSPDGRSVIIGSDRSGGLEAWLVPVRNERPAGTPEVLTIGLGQITPLRVTSEGDLYYRTNERATEVYTGTLNAATGQVGALRSIATRHANVARSAAWSPDGGRLAYRTTNSTISVLSIDTGREQDFQVAGLGLLERPIGWTRDGSALLLTAGVPASRRADLYRLQLDTQELRLLVRAEVPEAGGHTLLHCPSLSPDERTLYYLDNDRSIQALDLETGQTRTLYAATATESVTVLALSPDGDRLAVRREVIDTGASSLMTLSVDGDEPRVVIRLPDEADAPPAYWLDRTFAAPPIGWSGDGRDLFFIARHAGDSNDGLWQVAAQGGIPKRMGLTIGRVEALSVHPDGRQLALTGRREERRELWVIEHVLPAATVRR